MNPITPKYFDFGNGYTRFGRFSSFPTYKNGSFVSEPVFQLHKRNVAGQFVILQQLRISSDELNKLIATKDTLKAENLTLFDPKELLNARRTQLLSRDSRNKQSEEPKTVCDLQAVQHQR